MGEDKKLVYWRRELPPFQDRTGGEYVVEAQSPPIPFVMEEKESLWARCHEPLMQEAEHRIGQEVSRLGGDCAHVIGEDIDEKHDYPTSTYRLKGRFRFVLFLAPEAPKSRSRSSSAEGGASKSVTNR